MPSHQIMPSQTFRIARCILSAAAAREDQNADQYTSGNLARKIAIALTSAEREKDEYHLLITGRIIAELYVLLMRRVSNNNGTTASLYDEIRKLPAWGGRYRAAHFIRPNPGVWQHCAEFNISPRVYQDLQFLRRCGNIACHANTRIENEHRSKELAAKARESICRIGIVSAVWAARLTQSNL